MVLNGTDSYLGISVGCSIVSPMGFLPLPGWVPLRCNSRCIPSPFRGGFFVIACFDFMAYFLGGSKYVVITFRVATSTSLPPLKGEVAALADGEVLPQSYISNYRNQCRKNQFFLHLLKIDLGQQIWLTKSALNEAEKKSTFSCKLKIDSSHRSISTTPKNKNKTPVFLPKRAKNTLF